MILKQKITHHSIPLKRGFYMRKKIQSLKVNLLKDDRNFETGIFSWKR